MIMERTLKKEEISFRHVSNLLDGMESATNKLLQQEKTKGLKREMLQQDLKKIDTVKKHLYRLKTAHSKKNSIDCLSHLKLHSNKAAKLRKKMINGAEKETIKLQRNMFKHFGKKGQYKSDRTYKMKPLSSEVHCYDYSLSSKVYGYVSRPDFEELFRRASNNEKSKVSKETKKEIKEKRTKAINDKYPIRTAYFVYPEEPQVLKKVKDEREPETQYVFKELAELEIVNFCLGLKVPKVLSENASELQKRRINKYHKSVQKKRRVTSKMEKNIMKLINLRDEKIDIELAISTLNDIGYLSGDKKRKIQDCLTKELAKRNKKEQKILNKINKNKKKINFRNYLNSYRKYYELHNLERIVTKEKLNQQEKNACSIRLSSKWDTILEGEIFPEKIKADKPTDSDNKNKEVEGKFLSSLHVEVNPTIKRTDNSTKTNDELTNNSTKTDKNGNDKMFY